MVDLQYFSQPERLYILVASIVLICVIIVELIEYKIKRKNYLENQLIINKHLTFLKQINNIRVSKDNPSLALELIDQTAKSFFENEYNLDRNLDYDELSIYFSQMKEEEAVKLCNEMLNIIYSGSTITEKRVIQLKERLNKLIEEKVKPFLPKNEEKSLLGEYFSNISESIKKKSKEKKNKEHLKKNTKENNKLLESKYYQKKAVELEEKITEKNKQKYDKPIIEKPNIPKILFKKEKLNIDKKKDKNRKDKDNIESIDSLDRIKEKIKQVDKKYFTPSLE